MTHHDIVTGREAADLLGVPRKRVAVWIQHERVKPFGLIPGRSRGGHGVPVFNLDDFRPLADAYHARSDTTDPRTEGACTRTPDQGG